MNFAETTQYLLSLGNEVSSMKLGLVNIRTLLAALGNPQNNYLKIQVAGTNGKGSVCVFLDAICHSAGVQTGLYTSPHLVSITERIKIKGSDIDEDEFARLATTIRETAERLLENRELENRPTFFEQVTAIALVAFAEAKVDLAILETGLGGRLDATTAANAEIAAITPISIDHQEYLGETLAEIAVEKAAIIHESSNVIIGEQNAEAKQIICGRLELFQINASFAADVSTTADNGWLNFRTKTREYRTNGLGLAGRHQIENAKIAILLAETLQKSLTITPENIVNGLENARHPGRLEYQGEFLFDGAHNMAGAKALSEYLDEFVTTPVTLIFGAMKGKDISAIAGILFPIADKIILTRPENSRSMTDRELSEFLPKGFERDSVFLTNTVAEAIKTAKQTIFHDGVILITGSLYLVGEAKSVIKHNSEFEI